MQKMTGQVKTTRHAKGFGFITGDDGLDRFFHVTSMVGGQPLPPEGARVVFVAKEDRRGPAAIQVTPLARFTLNNDNPKTIDCHAVSVSAASFRGSAPIMVCRCALYARSAVLDSPCSGGHG
ncbi:cold-shock protein [Modicisalibacter luteus]|uniref:Cold-shock protein n=1 Tax=Modicisalibacter luteus TaxID=453962 RepID=A0ABV7M7I3_9GAMM|nr:cold shock domain-containing protein [Halomonas lutea]